MRLDVETRIIHSGGLVRPHPDNLGQSCRVLTLLQQAGVGMNGLCRSSEGIASATMVARTRNELWMRRTSTAVH